MPGLKVRRIRVRAGKLDVETETPLQILYVSEDAARRVLGLLPNLSRHICLNGKGETFGDEVVGTELPHLLEHLVIELQGRARTREGGNAGDASGLFRGHTSWAAELAETSRQGIALMRTTVTFENDLVALQALKEGVAILDWAVAGGASPGTVNRNDTF